MPEKIKSMVYLIKQKVKLNFLSITLNFIFIFIYMNVFQIVFGPENSILGVVFIIIMQSSMLLDFSITPINCFVTQLCITEMMVISAFLIQNFNPMITIPLNFMVLLFILYVYTFEYTAALYMPYIISYLFLVFISPVNIVLLPTRMVAVIVGSASVIIYHLIKGHNRSKTTVHTVVCI